MPSSHAIAGLALLLGVFAIGQRTALGRTYAFDPHDGSATLAYLQLREPAPYDLASIQSLTFTSAAATIFGYEGVFDWAFSELHLPFELQENELGELAPHPSGIWYSNATPPNSRFLEPRGIVLDFTLEEGPIFGIDGVFTRNYSSLTVLTATWPEDETPPPTLLRPYFVTKSGVWAAVAPEPTGSRLLLISLSLLASVLHWRA
ncbi:hypothetical protein Pla123a_04610 [Posidoniimonas polymericola]|uniref:Uncharacterized protein n=1 Tax=Posidoniimonas polymericola TaxID=2528002 RepID=A0A5C5ZE73_9BACT|nr:hypothetical protein Pla123a_04610 [Posidoniimonas polymericola]